MMHTLSPLLKDLQSESVLFQAWKKTEAHIRAHNWYADTLELDWQALRLPDFIAGIQKRIQSGTWQLSPLRMVPAPKSQSWGEEDGIWKPIKDVVKIRPLAHVSLEDQVICTAILLCLADRVENLQSDPTGSDASLEDRKQLLSYGHRLYCRKTSSGQLYHAWAAKKLYRLYSADYRRFLARPENVAKTHKIELGENESIAIVSADFSRFYDRIRPAILREQLIRLKQDDEEQSFFDYIGHFFDWRWDLEDQARALHYAENDAVPKIEDFDQVALPQGLVSAGFFANVALLHFDDALSKLIGKPIKARSRIKLLDACRYVDDIRLVIKIPKSLSTDYLENRITQWLDSTVGKNMDLVIEKEKTQVIILGDDNHPVVPQSQSAERIQHAISGGFDIEQGMNIIDALEGFINAQHRYSSEEKKSPSGMGIVMKGVSDMRDETAARFHAFRYRATFRSLRPLLDSEISSNGSDPENIDDEEVEISLLPSDAIVSREQFDDRGLLFASSQIAEWEANPAQVRLMRIAVDLFPRAEFCERILKRLRPSYKNIIGINDRQREVLLYCLAELFRAGATETGIVSDLDELPGISTETNALEYHDILLSEGREILSAAAKLKKRSNRFPWYLLQQVLLYFATRQESIENVDLSNLSKIDDALQRYMEMYSFYAESFNPKTQADRANFIVMQALSFGQNDDMVARVAKHPNSALLRALAIISPKFFEEVWAKMKSQKRRSLEDVAVTFGLASPFIKQPERLTCAADMAGLQQMVWNEEYNLVALACDLMKARLQKRDSVLTPWQIYCELKHFKSNANDGLPISKRIKVGKTKILQRKGGECLFELPDWCKTQEEMIRVEVGQILRYLLTGSVEYFRPVTEGQAKKNLPQYRRALSSWELGRYGSFNGRSAFGPDWLPLSSWTENLLVSLLRWPGCGILEEAREIKTSEWISHLESRLKKLRKMRGEATGMLFLNQDAHLPRRKAKKWERPLRIGIVQSVVPDVPDFIEAIKDGDLQLNKSEIRQKHRRHLRFLLQGVKTMLDARLSHLRDNKNPNLDWLIFPELAIHPDDVVPLLLPIVRRYKCIILTGLVYHPKDSREPNSDMINSALWLIPEWSNERGLQVSRIEQGKARLAPCVEEPIDGLIGFRPAQWIIRYYWSSSRNNRPLLLSASVCYDATDTALAHDLRNRNDFFAICALNKDTHTYDNIAVTLNYHLFQGVLVVNNGQYGGSNFHAPLRESYERKIIHSYGLAQASIGFAEICPQKFVDRPHGDHKNKSPVGEWKSPPAGWVGPKKRRRREP